MNKLEHPHFKRKNSKQEWARKKTDFVEECQTNLYIIFCFRKEVPRVETYKLYSYLAYFAKDRQEW